MTLQEKEVKPELKALARARGVRRHGAEDACSEPFPDYPIISPMLKKSGHFSRPRQQQLTRAFFALFASPFSAQRPWRKRPSDEALSKYA
jgi:hypothetical protein